jgi:NAD-dependent deacetylase
LTSELVERAASLLVEARRTVVLTGAGISTPSGIPDFRSPGDGLWVQREPEDVASLRAFLRDPAAFAAWLRPLLCRIIEAEPNPAHRALAELEQAGLVRAIITQNIDGLHQRAGSQRVLELHGHLRESTCLRCGRKVPTARLIETFMASGELSHCSECGGTLKPDIVLFGEVLPEDVLVEAEEEVASCDLIWVVGSSLVVAPASFLPRYALAHGAGLIIANREPTSLDPLAELILRGDVAELLPAIAAACHALLSGGRCPHC